MQLIVPEATTDATLQSSNVAENDYPLFDIATTYAINETVIYVVTNTHWVIRSLVSANVGNVPTGVSTDTKWVKISQTNRWKMFDLKTTSQTYNLNLIDVILIGVSQIDSISILNIDAALLEITGKDQFGATFYTYIANLVSTEGIYDPYTYFFSPLIYLTDVVLQDLPPYALASYQITLTNTGNTVKCGTCIIGKKMPLGDTKYGMQVGITDYSVKRADEFGDFTITERAYSKTLNASSYVPNTQINAHVNLLNRFRATPLVWIGTELYSSSFIYGFYKDYQVIVEYPTHSLINLEIEGLT